MNNPPILDKFPVPLKIITFGMVIFSSFILVSVFGIAASYPFFGRNVLQNLSLVGDSSDADIIAVAKYFQIVSQLGFFIVPALIFAYLDGKSTGKYLKINFTPAFKAVLLAGITIIVAVPLINYIAEINQQMSLPAAFSGIEDWMKNSESSATKLTENFLNVSTVGGLLINILMMAVMPAIGEEFVFRGVLQRLFSSWTNNVHVSIFLSAFLFSAIHFQFFGFFPRFLIGVLLGYSYIWSGSLWVPIFIHFVNNAAAVLISYLAKIDILDSSIETIGAGDSDMPAVIISTVLTTVFIFFIFYLGKRKKLSSKIE